METAMTQVFLNYRGSDEPWAASRLYHGLVERLGKGNVFLDYAEIPLGDDSREVLLTKVRTCLVLVAVVGENWRGLGVGDRRIDQEEDWVRLEIATALRAGVRIIPVLLDNTPKPNSEDLPADIRDIAALQYRRIRHHREHVDIPRLIDEILALEPRLSGGPKASRVEIDRWVREVLPAVQQFAGNREDLADVAWSLLQDDERHKFLAPCNHARRVPGSAVLLLTSRRVYIADLDNDSRIERVLPLMREHIIACQSYRRRRVGIVKVMDVTLLLRDGGKVVAAGLLHAQGERVLAELGFNREH
jgi:hypothetical protein